MINDISMCLPPTFTIGSLLEELRGSVDKLHVAMLLRELSKMIRTNAEWIVEGPIVAEVTIVAPPPPAALQLLSALVVCRLFYSMVSLSTHTL